MLSESAQKDLYDHLVYGCALISTSIAYSQKTANLPSSVVFNGWIRQLDRSSGHETITCLATLHTTVDAFGKVNLANVDPKACFKAFKGIAGTRLTDLAAVRPILTLKTSDSRFVASVAVLDRVDEGSNIALMGWEEFEHLIREIFQAELSGAGAEVKITQASRDGGVDAVAFDPDPIRGGKIVIQAKRYTNTVDVSAVRDLYGTVMSEGASKGILVTTSSFGPDAYTFAKDKPLVLMSGANLLYLLEKHGRRFKIDLAEAKRLGNALQR